MTLPLFSLNCTYLPLLKQTVSQLRCSDIVIDQKNPEALKIRRRGRVTFIFNEPRRWRPRGNAPQIFSVLVFFFKLLYCSASLRSASRRGRRRSRLPAVVKESLTQLTPSVLRGAKLIPRNHFPETNHFYFFNLLPLFAIFEQENVTDMKFGSCSFPRGPRPSSRNISFTRGGNQNDK